ncbi:hypothetical protein Tco_1329638 [Tanacetum coccineum]
MEKMEAFTTKIESELNENKGEMKEMREGCAKCGEHHRHWSVMINRWEDPMKKQNMLMKDIVEEDITETTTVEVSKIFTVINDDSDDEGEEKAEDDTLTPSTFKQTEPIPMKAYKPRILYPQRLKKIWKKNMAKLVSNKNKQEDISAVFLNEECSVVIQNKIPPKLKDLGRILIPYTLGNSITCNALADLGASINLMPYSLYAKLSGDFEADFPAIVYNDALTSNENVSPEPTVSIYNAIKTDFDFSISFSDSDDEDYTFICDKDSFSYKLIPVDKLKPEPVNEHIEINTELCSENIDIKPMDSVVCISNDTTPVESDEHLETNHDKKSELSETISLSIDLLPLQTLIVPRIEARDEHVSRTGGTRTGTDRSKN